MLRNLSAVQFRVVEQSRYGQCAYKVDGSKWRVSAIINIQHNPELRDEEFVLTSKYKCEAIDGFVVKL